MELNLVYLYVICCIISIDFVGCEKSEWISDCFIRYNSSNVYDDTIVTFKCSTPANQEFFSRKNHFKCSNGDISWPGTVNFENCKFREFFRNFFVDFPKMHTFNVTGVDLETLETKYFGEAKYVTRLIASKNKITEIPPNVFINANKLKQADFANNKIRKVDAFAFEGVHELEMLNLSQNALTEIDARIFSNLSNLLQLDLSENSVKFLPTHVFDQNTKLVFLNLALNPIGNVKNESFANLTELKYLNLRRTNISTIEPGTFSHQHKLVSLDLSENFLIKIEFSNFPPMLPDLLSLNLSGNEITTMQGFSNALFPQLALLDIRGNQFICTFLERFMESVNWEKIHLPADKKSLGNSNIRNIKCEPVIESNFVVDEPNYEVKFPKNVLIEKCSKFIYKSHTDMYLIMMIILLIIFCVLLFISNRRKYFNVSTSYDQGIELS